MDSLSIALEQKTNLTPKEEVIKQWTIELRNWEYNLKTYAVNQPLTELQRDIWDILYKKLPTEEKKIRNSTLMAKTWETRDPALDEDGWRRLFLEIVGDAILEKYYELVLKREFKRRNRMDVQIYALNSGEYEKFRDSTKNILTTLEEIVQERVIYKQYIVDGGPETRPDIEALLFINSFVGKISDETLAAASGTEKNIRAALKESGKPSAELTPWDSSLDIDFQDRPEIYVKFVPGVFLSSKAMFDRNEESFRQIVSSLGLTLKPEFATQKLSSETDELTAIVESVKNKLPEEPSTILEKELAAWIFDFEKYKEKDNNFPNFLENTDPPMDAAVSNIWKLLFAKSQGAANRKFRDLEPDSKGNTKSKLTKLIQNNFDEFGLDSAPKTLTKSIWNQVMRYVIEQKFRDYDRGIIESKFDVLLADFPFQPEGSEEHISEYFE